MRTSTNPDKAAERDETTGPTDSKEGSGRPPQTNVDGVTASPVTIEGSENPHTVQTTTDDERADMLADYLSRLADEFGEIPQLLPLDEEGKAPIIGGRCSLDSPMGRGYLVDGEEAVRQIREEGARGFAIYAGKSDHNTEKLVLVDVDDRETFPYEAFPATLTVLSGSGRGEHFTYRNGGDVANAKGKDGVDGEVRAENWFCVTPGSIHTSGGVYHIHDSRDVATLDAAAIPDSLQPTGGTPTTSTAETGEAADPLDVEYDPDPDANVANVLHNNPWIINYLTGAEEADDRSTKDHAVCRAFVAAGISEKQAYETLNSSQYTKVFERGANYWRRTWTSAITAEAEDEPNAGAGGDERTKPMKDGVPQSLLLDVHRGGYGYWDEKTADEGSEWKAWTNFQIEATSFLTVENGTERIGLTVYPNHGEPYDVTVEPTTFNEKREFKRKVACGRTTTFTGGESALAKIKQFVGTQDAPNRRGVRHMGLHGDEFVTPNGTLTADGWADDPDHVHVPREIEAERRWSLSPDDTADGGDGAAYDQEAIRDILTLLPQTRDPERFIPVLGWFYAAPLRPLIYDWADGEFNHLSVTGETEAGKTSTLEVMWELFGMTGNPLSADDTKFTVQATLGSSNAVPIWFDEFKPSDMAHHRIDTFQNELRKTTRGGTSQRGRPDGSTYAFHLHAPTVISGEERVQGPAEERRGIFSTFRAATTTEGSDHAIAFARLAGGSAKVNGEVRHFEGIDLSHHAIAYYQWVLDQDRDELRELWRETATHVNGLLQAEDVGTLSSLVEQGLRTIKFGATLYRAFAAEMGVAAHAIDTTGVSTGAIDDAIIYIATSSTGGQNRQSHLDTFIALAGRAAHADYIEEGEHYTFTHRGEDREQLRINFTRTYDPVSKYVRDHDVSEDLLGGATDYLDRAADSQDHISYVKCVKQPTQPVGRCVGIHTEAANETITEFERALFAGEPDELAGNDGDETDHMRATATPIRDLEHGGNPYHTLTATVLSVGRDAPDNGPEITGVIEDATGAIDFIAWNECAAAAALADGEGHHYVIERARLSTDREGDDVIDIENATVEPLGAGVAYIPTADPGRNATLGDGGEPSDQTEWVDSAEQAIDALDEDDGADPTEVRDQLTGQGLTDDQADWVIGKLLNGGRASELPNGRYVTE